MLQKIISVRKAFLLSRLLLFLSKKKTMIKIILPLLLLLGTLYSCRYHEGTIASNATITPASEIAAFAEGEAQTSLVFGFGGLNTKTLIKDAKENLYRNYPLKKGQAYANMGVDVSRSFYPFVGLPVVMINRVVVSADVVNLDPELLSDELQPFFISLQERWQEGLEAMTSVSWMQVQDSLLLLQGNSAQKVMLQDIVSQKKAIVSAGDGKMKRANTDDLYVFQEGLSIQNQKYRVGDLIVTKAYGYEASGIVVGINPFGVLLQTDAHLLTLDNKILQADEDRAEEPAEE